jgi:hypothetical protein
VGEGAAVHICPLAAQPWRIPFDGWRNRNTQLQYKASGSRCEAAATHQQHSPAQKATLRPSPTTRIPIDGLQVRQAADPSQQVRHSVSVDRDSSKDEGLAWHGR